MQVLGPVALQRGIDPVPSSSALLRTFLALLVVSRQSRAPADTVIDELWGESLPREPRPALQALASRLRRWIREAGGGPDDLRFEHDSYILAVPSDRVDLHRFVSAAEAVLEQPDGNPTNILSYCDRARAEWLGQPFGGCAPSPRLDNERLRLQELALTVAERRCAVLIDLGQHERAVAELQSLLVEHPGREHLTALAMVGLHRAGRQREALQLYQRTRRVLAEDFGLDPSPELAGLEQRLVRRDRDLSAAVVVAPAPGPTSVRPVVVGRGKELGQIADQARAGQRTVVVTGEAGAGKTTLLQAAAVDATAGGSLVGMATFERGDAPLSA